MRNLCMSLHKVSQITYFPNSPSSCSTLMACVMSKISSSSLKSTTTNGSKPNILKYLTIKGRWIDPCGTWFLENYARFRKRRLQDRRCTVSATRLLFCIINLNWRIRISIPRLQQTMWFLPWSAYSCKRSWPIHLPHTVCYRTLAISRTRRTWRKTSARTSCTAILSYWSYSPRISNSPKKRFADISTKTRTFSTEGLNSTRKTA